MADTQDLTAFIGRHAVLNSGGPPMLIEGVTPDQEFVCSWDDTAGERQVSHFLPATVQVEPAPEAPPVAEAPPAAPVFDLAEKMAEGYRFERQAHEWAVMTPDGEYGHGASPEDAVRNVGAVIVPNADGRRVLTRRDGSDVALDAPLVTEG